MTEPGATSGGGRRGRPGYDQETVLRRAVELFNRQGYDGTSMGDLARELGFTKSAIYHHVPSKQHLLAQALDEPSTASPPSSRRRSNPRPGSVPTTGCVTWCRGAWSCWWCISPR